MLESRGGGRNRWHIALRRGADAAAIVLTVALLTGFVEVVILLVRRIAGRFIFTVPEFMWMTPASYALVFWKIALTAAVVAAVIRRAPLQYVAVLPAVLLAGFSLLLMVPGLDLRATAVLALGIAVELSRRAGGRLTGFTKAVWRVGPLLAAISMLIAFGLPAKARIAESAAQRKLGAARRDAPNVLFIILDTVRAASTGLHGYARLTTPNLDKLARTGVVFERAYATAPWTLPTHATLFTGRYPHQFRADWERPLEGKFVTLAEAFRDHGYQTAGFAANQSYVTKESGLTQGFLHFRESRISVRQIALSSSLGQLIAHNYRKLPNWRYERRMSGAINAELLGWLRQRPPGHPFFAFLNYMDAHGPYYVRGTYLKQIGGDPNNPQDRYDAGIARMDEAIGELLAALESDGLLDNTIVVITSDHGELFGEHGLYKHGNALYEPLLHVPLLMTAPEGLPAGQRVKEAVTLRDVAQTILQLAGIREDALHGNSLANVVAGRPSESPILATVRKGINTPPEEPVTRGDMHSILNWPWHYVQNGDRSVELYNLLQDPQERRDLARAPGARMILLEQQRAMQFALGK